MNRYLLNAVALASLGFVAATHAGSRSGDEQLIDACVEQYIANNLADYPGKVTVNKLATGYQPITLSGATQVKVTAVHRTTGTNLGTVVCNVSREGKVTVATPTGSAAAKLAKLNKATVIASTSAE